MDCYKACVVCLSLLLSACATTPAERISPKSNNPEFPSVLKVDATARVQEAFSRCKHDALELDKSAREQKSPAQYAASAKTIDLCLVEVDEQRDAISVEQRMQIHALMVLNYFKAGDIKKARLQLHAFELSYPGRDLYFQDYTSFIDSFRVLLDYPNVRERNIVKSRAAEGRISNYAAYSHSRDLLNINPDLASEIARYRYWQTH